MNILFATSEVSPYSKTGGLADVSRSLPAELKRLGHDVSIVTPLYKNVDPNNHQLAERLTVLEVPTGDGTETVRILEGRTPENVRIFFLSHECFDRDPIYGPAGGGEYEDNGFRFGLFCRAVCELIGNVALPVDIIHCNDWQTGLIPVFLEEKYATSEKLAGAVVVSTIHNLAYQGVFPKETLGKLGLPDSLFAPEHLEYYEKISFLKGGILYSDALTTVSEGYAKEILTEEYGAGLHGVLNRRKDDLTGIVNGVDYKTWDPETDPLIPVNYDKDHLNGKRRCKAALQTSMDLPLKPTTPLFAFVGRLAEQKGIDLISDLLDEMMYRKIQLVMVGEGESHYEAALQSWAEEFPEQVAVYVGFSEEMAHTVIAGADALLLPSRYEPCGLTQLYAMRYGTLPIARATGGLKDTIEGIEIEDENSKGTGILFRDYDADSFFDGLMDGLDLFDQPRRWRASQIRAMGKNYSWRRSAEAYVELYTDILPD